LEIRVNFEKFVTNTDIRYFLNLINLFDTTPEFSSQIKEVVSFIGRISTRLTHCLKGNMDKSNHLSKLQNKILDAILSLEIQPRAIEQEVDENTNLNDLIQPTPNNILRRVYAIEQLYFDQGTLLNNWDKLSPELLNLGLIEVDGDHISLTQQGRSAALRARTKRMGQIFSDKLIRCQTSQAFSEFCRRVFGKDLNQADMMDMPQLEKMLEVLKLSEKNRVLDIACGTGQIAEYISAKTGANVLGIDIAAGAIQNAQQRTQGQRHRLDYQTGSMDHLDFPSGSFDTVIAIASIQYANDKSATMGQIKQALSSGGQLAIFSFQYQGEDDPPEILLPENSEVGKVMEEHGFSFQTWDFTQQEIAIRKKQLQTANDLLADFEAEGNLDLAEDRIEESEIDLPLLEAGKKRRYLYVAKG
jgi:SAM-dependent methyltransferase